MCNQEVSLLFFPTVAKKNPVHHSGEKLQAPHEGIIDTPSASP